MFRVTIKGLFAHKLRFGLTALAVLLGVAFMSGTFVLTDTVQGIFDDLFANVNKGTDAYVRSNQVVESDFGPSQRPRIPESVLASVRAIDGVAAAEPNLQLNYAQLVDEQGKPVGNPAQGAPTLGFNWVDNPELESFDIQPGGRPPRTRDEVVIDKGSADKTGYQVGDTTRARVLTALGDPRKRYEIVGIAKFGDADSPAGASVSIFTLAEAQSLGGAAPPAVPEKQIDAVTVVADDGISQEEIRGRLADGLKEEGIKNVDVLTGAQITKENQDDIAQNLQFFSIILTVAAAVALLVGMFIIFNTFSIVITQRIRELALLRALGASGRQVRVAVLGEALAVGFVASAAGIFVGIGLAVVLKAALNAFGFEIPSGSLVIKPRGVMIAMTAGMVVTLVSAVAPAIRASRVAPLAAIRSVSIERSSLFVRTLVGALITVAGLALMVLGLGGRVSNGIAFVGLGAAVVFIGVAVFSPAVARPVAGALGLPIQRLRGVSGRIARENAVRNPRRTATTAAALMIGVALVVMITVLASSIQASVNSQVDRAFTADFIVAPSSFGGGSGTGVSPKLATKIAALPQVEAASGVRFAQAKIDGNGTFFLAVNTQVADKVLDLDVREGALADIGKDGMGVSGRVARDRDWKLGTKVPADFGVADRDLTVDAIFERGQREGLADYFLSLETLDSLDLPDQLDQQIYVRLAPGVTLEAGQKALELETKAYPTVKVQDRDALKDSIAGQINQLIKFLFVLLALAVVIAFIGIVNTLALSVLERTREIGLLRAVGMSRRQLRIAVRWEAVIVALFGAVLGLVIGVTFGWAIVKALRDQGFETFAAPAKWLILTAVVAAFFGVLAAIYPAWRATRMNILESISSE